MLISKQETFLTWQFTFLVSVVVLASRCLFLHLTVSSNAYYRNACVSFIHIAIVSVSSINIFQSFFVHCFMNIYECSLTTLLRFGSRLDFPVGFFPVFFCPGFHLAKIHTILRVLKFYLLILGISI